MPSSTSSSSPAARLAPSNRAIAILLALLACVGLGAEFGAKLITSRISKLERRNETERAQAASLRPTSADGKPTMLLVGNSLLYDAIDVPAIRAQLGGTFVIDRFAIFGTWYLDWYFGLKKLYREGSSPSVTVLFLSVPQIVSPATSGEFFAWFFMDRRDTLDVQNAAGLDNTTASNLWFASWSDWLGFKTEIRKGILGALLPDIDTLRGHITGPPTHLNPDPKLLGIMTARFRDLKQLETAFGGRFLLVVPPMREPYDGLDVLRTAAAQASLDVLVPYRNLEMPADCFSDGFHLNKRGSAQFTSRLAEQLRPVAKTVTIVR